MAGVITPTSFNGHDISAASVYRAIFVRDSGIGDVFESQQVTAEVAGNFPQYVFGQPQGRVLIMRIELVGAARTYTNLKQLKQWFNARNDEVTLGATNENGDALTLTVKPLGLSPVDGFDGHWDAKLWTSVPIWRALNATDHTQNVASDSSSWSETNSGSDSVLPRLTLTPKAQKTAGNGPASMRRIVVANRSSMVLADANGNPWPVDITNGGFDATAKIKAEAMHPQGYDVHVLVDGVEVNRYLSNWGAGFGNASAPHAHSIATTTSYVAQRFRLPGCAAAETNTINEVGLYLKKSGTPTGTLTFKIRVDNNGVPGAVVANGTSPATANVSTLTDSYAYLNAVYSTKPVLNAKTWYWLELDPSGITFGGGFISAGLRLGTLVNASYAGIYEGLFAAVNTSADESAWSNPFVTTPATLAFRVYVNGNAKIWTPMLLEATVTRTLGMPLGMAAEMRFAESGATEGLQENTAWLVEDEAVVARGKLGTDGYTVAQRHVRGTAVLNHPAGVSATLLQNYVQLLFNDLRPNDLNPTGYEPADYAPCIDGITSTNSSMVWRGPFINSPTRPMIWRTILDSSVALSATTSMDADATNDETQITFKDAAPAGTYIARNMLEQRFAVPIKDGVSALTLDETIPPSLSVQHLFTNAGGDEAIGATHRSVDSGTGKTITTASLVYRERMRVLNEAIVGCETNDLTDSTGASVSGMGQLQVFQLDAPAAISAVAVRINWPSGVYAGSSTGAIRIYGATDYGVANGPVRPSWTNLYFDSGSIDIVTGYTTDVPRTVTVTPINPIVLDAGRYAVGLVMLTPSSIGGATRPSLSAAVTAFARGDGYYNATGADGTDGISWTLDSNRDYWFRIYGTGTVQDDTPSGTGATCTVDNIIAALDTTLCPKVIFESTDQAIVYVSPTITVQHPAGYGADNSVGIAAVMKVNGNLDIDWDAKTVTSDDVDLADPACPSVIVSIDELDPYRYEPGTNTVTYAESGQTGSGIDVRSRFWAQHL